MKIYLTKIEPLKKELSEVLPLINCNRREKVSKIIVEEAKLQSLYAGLLVRYAYLQENLKTPWNEVLVDTDKNGKPKFVNVDGIYYSISHSKNYCLVVFDDTPVGCDIQYNQNVQENIVERFFPASEINMYKSAIDPQIQKRIFYQLWGMKESCSKLDGDGIPYGLSRYVYHNDELAFDNELNKNVNIKYYSSIIDYTITVASNDSKKFPDFINLVDASDLY